MNHKHLMDVDPNTLSPEELKERLAWRDAHPAEVLRHEREQNAQRALDRRMEVIRESFLASGGTEEEFRRVRGSMREEIASEDAKALADRARAAQARQVWSNF